MKHQNFLFLALATLLIFGCKAQTSAEETVTAPAVTAAAVTLPAEQLLGQKLKKEMPYAELRELVLAEGWLPLVTPECKENVGGEATICDRQPEVESCSGDGHCNMQFAHGDSQTKLRVGTYADNTKFWEFSVLESPDNALVDEGKEASGADSLAAEACTQKGYWSFFESFVKSEPIRKSHTSPNVTVRSYSGNAKVEGKFEQFKIGLFDNTWIYIDSAKKTSTVQRLDLKDEVSGNSFRVNYQKADFGPDEELIKTIGAPGAYVFELQNGCWQLTQELR